MKIFFIFIIWLAECGIEPSKSSIKAVISKCATIILKEGKAISQSDLIRRLNQVLRGWSNYHRHRVASQAVSYINNTIYLTATMGKTLAILIRINGGG